MYTRYTLYTLQRYIYTSMITCLSGVCSVPRYPLHARVKLQHPRESSHLLALLFNHLSRLSAFNLEVK